MVYNGQNCAKDVITIIAPTPKATHFKLPSNFPESPRIIAITPTITRKNLSPFPTFFFII